MAEKKNVAAPLLERLSLAPLLFSPQLLRRTSLLFITVLLWVVGFQKMQNMSTYTIQFMKEGATNAAHTHTDGCTDHLNDRHSSTWTNLTQPEIDLGKDAKTAYPVMVFMPTFFQATKEEQKRRCRTAMFAMTEDGKDDCGEPIPNFSEISRHCEVAQ